MGLIADIHNDLEKGAVRLMSEYRVRLTSDAIKFCKNASDAEDLVSRTLVKVINKIDSYDSNYDFYVWMKTIMVNIHRNDQDRPVARGTVPVEDVALEQYAGADWSTDEEILRNSDREFLHELLKHLDPADCEALLMRYYDGLSLKEIASFLNKPVSTVGRRIQVAVRLLSGKLGVEMRRAKKPLAVLLAALLGVGSIFGAWHAGLLDSLLSRSGEAESFPLQEETVPPQIQPQPETILTQEESQPETTKEQPMNMKTVKTLAASAVVAANAVVLNAATSAGYVQDGLIAMWDGYENNGAGGHATELTEWKDTTGRYSFVFDENSGIEVGDDRLVFSGASGCCAELNADGTANTFARASDGTVEVVFKAASDTPSISFVLHSTVSSGIAFSRYGSFGSAMQWIVSNKYSPMSVFNAHEEVTTVVLQYASGVASNSFVNGQVTAKSGSDNWGSAGAGTMLGARGGTKTNPFKGEVCAIRLYSTPLTPEQIKANRSVDVKRFMEGKLGDGPGVTVWGSPKSYATATGVPQYGFFPCAEGKTFTMSMPPSFVAADGHTIECLGWKHYDSASGALIDESTEQDKLTCEFNFATDVKLVWQWRVLNVLTVRNFDEDLATVYVNDEPATNGQRIAVDGTVKIELKNFRDDYYFSFAPESQTDRTLAFDCWEGVPTGYEGANPTTFTVEGDLTITPNVNVKGYCWTYDNGVIEDCKFRYGCSKDDDSRTISCSSCITNLLGATEKTLTLDAVERVRVDGKNYTITAFTGRPAFEWSYMCEMAIAPRFSTFGYCITDHKYSSFLITNIVGLAEANVKTVDGYAFNYSPAVFNGPATNFVPRTAETLGDNSYSEKSGMTGLLVLDSVKSIGNNSFYGCFGLTELYCTSPHLTTIGGNAFAECRKMGKVTIGSSVLASVANSSFPANVTNFVFLGAAPSQAVAGNIVGKVLAAVVKKTRFTVDGSRGDWWALAKKPTEEELAAGLPTDCIGVLEDSSGSRKAWIVSDKPLEGMLIETDMTKVENEGYSIRAGLELGDELELIAPDGMSQCELQRMENGVWKTYDTQVGEHITYRHRGELTRAVWRIDGVTLNLSAAGYKGMLKVEVKKGELVASSNVYSRGAEVWVTAVGSAERPRSTISRWTGVPAGQEANETVKLVLNGDVSINALFRPVEWLYDPETKTITDGEYTSGARANDLIGEDGMSFAAFTGGIDYELWLDLSIPIYNPEDPAKDYWIAGVTSDRGGNACLWKRVRFGSNIVSMPGAVFYGSGNLDEVEHFSQIQVKSLANYFFYNYGNGGPIKNRTCEAEDFYPPSVKCIGSAAFDEGPRMKGKITVGLNNLANFADTLLPRCAAVTNWVFTAEDLPAISWATPLFAPTTVTFASTNLTLGASGWMVFFGCGDSLKDLTFLAHAPSAAVMNSLTATYLKNTNTVIHCSKYAPGWKELRMKGYSSCPEWDARPEGCWGMYQTDDGKKRFYLVQKNSKYDKRKGFAVLVK